MHSRHLFVRSRLARIAIMLVIVLAVATPLSAQSPVGTTIRFSRANMKLNGLTLNGTFDFRFKVFDSPTAGNQIGPIVTIEDVNVSGGSLPTLSLNFGEDVFNGEARWIEVRARQGTAAFAPVGLRNKVFAVPYALALPGLRTIQNADSPNIVAGFAGNAVAGNVVGATVSGVGIVDGANSAGAHFSTVGGGVSNSTAGNSSTVSGGNSNHATGESSTVSGGENNIASGVRSTIGGGSLNAAPGSHSIIAGGQINSASGFRSSIGGGFSNDASGESSTIGGGQNNTASGLNSTAVGGLANVAAGAFSLAAGRRAKADADGAFVWADTTDADFFSGGGNTFNVRCSGGAIFNSSSNLSTGVVLLAGGGSWDSFCDRDAKENFEEIDTRDILRRVVAMPLTTWNYKAQPEDIRHIGPMAQDFHAAFRLGASDKRITTIDADGVLFAAIQGLHQSHVEKEVEIATLRAELAALAMQLRDLRTAVEALTESRHSSNPTEGTFAP